jgi:uncharacterized protein DUF2490
MGTEIDPASGRVAERSVLRVLGVVTFLLAAPLTAQEDDTRWEGWPEVDVYVNLSERFRLYLLATTARNRAEDFGEGTLGAHVDLFLKPIGRPWLLRTPNVVKHHYLTFRAGYRYAWDLHDSSRYQENRGLLEATFRYLPVARVILINRSRLDLRDVNGERSWRYRNRSRLERDLPLGSRAATPYLMAEFFRDSRYDEWNRQRYFVGIEWPIGATTVLDSYYCRQNDSRSSIAHVNAVGLALNLYF